MEKTFDELDKWEEIPKKRRGKNALTDCAILGAGGIFSIAQNVTKQAGNPIAVKVQRMEQENMFFIRVIPVKKDPTSRAITYGEGNSAAVITAKALITPNIEEHLPMVFEVVRASTEEMVFVGHPTAKK